ARATAGARKNGRTRAIPWPVAVWSELIGRRGSGEGGRQRFSVPEWKGTGPREGSGLGTPRECGAPGPRRTLHEYDFIGAPGAGCDKNRVNVNVARSNGRRRHSPKFVVHFFADPSAIHPEVFDRR